jgi:hypothetical protein
MPRIRARGNARANAISSVPQPQPSS